MNGFNPESVPAPEKPFASPSMGENPSNAQRSGPNHETFWVCMIAANLVNVLNSYSFYTNENTALAHKLAWVIPHLAIGMVFGLGLALVVHAVTQRQFANLMPGHWRLIAFLSIWFTDYHAIVPPIFVLAFYVIVIRWTRERVIWKTYAWLCIAIALTGVIIAASMPIMRTAFASMNSSSDALQAANLMASIVSGVGAMASILSYAAIAVLIAGTLLDFRNAVRRD